MSNSIYITGISKGIGREISVQMQNSGFKTFGCSRSITADNCDALDVNNKQALSASLMKASQLNGKFQFVFLNAGIVSFQKKNTLDMQIEKQVIATNFISILDAIDIIDQNNLLAKNGKIVLIGSIADAKGWRGWGAYAASKASLNIIWQSYRHYFRNKGQDLYIYKFGFIKTDMVDHYAFPKPLMIDSVKAVNIMLKHLHKKRAHRIIPFSANLIYWSMRLLPISVVDFGQSLLPYEKFIAKKIK